MFLIPDWIKWVGGGIVILGIIFGVWCFTSDYKDAIWQEKFSTYQKDLAEMHQRNLNEVLNKEREAKEIAAKIEVKYHETTDQIKTLRNTNARLARELGGLRDPGKSNTTSGVGMSQGATSGNTFDPSTSSQLSREASQFLLDFAEDADRAAAYANACYEWVNREKLENSQILEHKKP